MTNLTLFSFDKILTKIQKGQNIHEREQANHCRSEKYQIYSIYMHMALRSSRLFERGCSSCERRVQNQQRVGDLYVQIADEIKVCE